MIIVDMLNARRVLRTISVEISEPEIIVQADIATAMYDFAFLHEGMFPSFMAMILSQDIAIHRLEKPFFHQELTYFYEIIAHLTDSVAKQYANGDVNALQSQFLTVIEGFISDRYVSRRDFIRPIVTVYYAQADKFNLTNSTILR